MKKHADQHKHAKTLHAAATTEVHDDVHETESHPEILDLSADQKALLASLHFLSEFQVAHLPKASPDIANAFDDPALATIGANASLGGAARVERIKELRQQQAALAAIAAVVAPVARLVGQNLMATSSALVTEAGEALRVANAMKASSPALAQGLASIAKWTHDHHRRGGSKAPAAPPNATAKA